MDGERRRGRPRKRWRDEVKDLVMGRGLSVREGMLLANEREGWGGVVYGSK